jgi:formate C-acetyltransferase
MIGRDFEVRPLDKIKITAEQRKELREVLIPFLKGNTLRDAVMAVADEELKDKAFSETASDPHLPVVGDLSLTKDLGHQVVNYEKVLHIGLKGVKEEVEKYLQSVDAPYVRYRKQEKRNFYEAALITLNAAIAYCQR